MLFRSPKPSTVWIATNCGKFFKRWEYQTTLPASREIFKKQQLEPDMEQWITSKLGKEYVKTILLPCLFNLFSEYITQNARLDEAQAGLMFAGRNSNNLRYTDDTLMAESKEELKSLLRKVKEESEKFGLKPSTQKTKIIACGLITSWK